MRHKKSKSFVCVITALILCMLGNTSIVYASDHVPYDTYNYNSRNYIVHTPAAYVPNGSVNTLQFGIGALNNPQDMCVAPDGNVYIADTNNNRIIVLDETMTELIKVIKEFDNNGAQDTFKRPFGVAVSNSNELYIADSENRRIVVLNQDGQLIKKFENPENEVLTADFVFTPQKIIVDYAERVYCIAQGVTEGIMVFEPDGRFTGYFGTIKVKISLWEKIWRKLSTKEQRSRQILYIAPEFTGIDVDDDGFIYASNLDKDGLQAVKRLNPKGEDVIVKGEKGNLGGDVKWGGNGAYSGASTIIDVVYRDKGIYSLLDSKRGRIFTYDSEGNLLYIFGGIGTQAGTFIKPVAIEQVGEHITVLDGNRSEILVFSPTQYGNLINEAVGLRYDGDETLAVEKWAEVLKLDENFELANAGIGKAYLTSGDNKLAMKYLKLGMSREYYSIAYKRYRNDILKDNLGYALTALLVLVLGIKGGKIIYRKKKHIIKIDDSEGGLE